ncbi:MAG TPA: PQQ-dependent sugar dehydrogenase, partial [Chloroflexota bacterium]|nr:PQQ-dependent sugar dehydrogenase [Chloroflexota bacterium]
MPRGSGVRRAVLAPLLAAVSLLLPSVAIAQSGPTATPPPAQTATPSPPAEAPRKLSAADIRLPAGYKIEPVVTNLSVLTTLAFDGRDLLVAESGWQDTAKPRVLRLSLDRPDGNARTLAAEGLEWPVTGLLMVDGRLYVSHKGKVSIVEDGGRLRDIVTDLPSKGDHQNNTLALGPDGKIYLGQGTVTNSGVVGIDNYVFGWLPENPTLHEVPCKDVTLVGENFETDDPLNRGGPRVRTGAYKPFGKASEPGEVVKGNPKCGGSIVRFDKDGSNFELVAWGLRNPYGLRFDRGGQLWATFHGADVRGSRNIFNDPDYLVRVEQGAWYGWP